MGGISRERKISLKSGSACFKALKNLGYKVKKFDPKFEKYKNIKKKTGRYYIQLFARRGRRRWLCSITF